jgi:hypothetical protein
LTFVVAADHPAIEVDLLGLEGGLAIHLEGHDLAQVLRRRQGQVHRSAQHPGVGEAQHHGDGAPLRSPQEPAQRPPDGRGLLPEVDPAQFAGALADAAAESQSRPRKVEQDPLGLVDECPAQPLGEQRPELAQPPSREAGKGRPQIRDHVCHGRSSPARHRKQALR